METPNADYNTLMDETKEAIKTFPEHYDGWMTKLAEASGLNEDIQKQLKAKRDFGLKKYGERAFQSTFENAISSPVGAHLGDELVDALNYALHGLWISLTSGEAERAYWYERLLEKLVDTVDVLAGLRSFLAPGEEKALLWTGRSSYEVITEADNDD
jgi:hypothetical protein